MKRHPTLVGIPVDSAGNAGGCERSPATLREFGLSNAVSARADRGDLLVRIEGPRDPKTGVVGFSSVLDLTSIVRDEVFDLLLRGEFPLLVGGCCSFVMGAIAGALAAHGRLGLAYIDGHLDLYDGNTSPTGECADMPLAFLVGRAPTELTHRMGARSPVTVGDAALLGYRDREDACSKGSIMPEDLGGDPFLADDRALIAQGPSIVGTLVRERLERRAGRFWIHLDFDVLDSGVFPAVDYSSPGGLDWLQLLELLDPLVSSRGLLGMSVACYNPDVDPGHRCARDAVGGLRQLFE